MAVLVTSPWLRALNVFVALLHFRVEHFPCESAITLEIGNKSTYFQIRSDNLTIMDATAEWLVLQFTCRANNPVEWFLSDVENVDIHYETYERKQPPEEEAGRSIIQHISNPSASYMYELFLVLHIEKKPRKNHIDTNGLGVVCRSVGNHSDNILQQLIPSRNGAEVHIHKYHRVATETEHRPLTNNTGGPISCSVTLNVAQIGSRTYLKCETSLDNIRSSLEVDFSCGCVSECNNKYRKEYKNATPPCVKQLEPGSVADSSQHIRKNWQYISDTLSYHYLATCKLPPQARVGRLAPIEISLEGKRVVGGKIVRQIRYGSRFGLPIENVIWLEPPLPRQTWYKNEILVSECIVPLHWFATRPVVVVTSNWTKVVYEATMRRRGSDHENYRRISRGKVRLNLTEVGVYQIQCLAPVWNSSEWANYTTTLFVKDAIPPRFAETNVSVQVREGEANRQLACDSEGDPVPTVFTWDIGQTPGIEIDGRVARFYNISTLFDNLTITCTTTNELGQRATKWFNIKLRFADDHDRVEDTGLSIGTIVAITCGFGSLLVLGVIFMYFKFRNLESIQTNLTQEQVEEFRDGRSGVQMPEEFAIECLPYNSKYDMQKENFIVDFNSVLGSGAYGIVYNGCIRKNNDRVNVAVKTVHSNVHIDYFKALLSELKILAYIGHHENIVNLIGAYTENIKNRELYVGVELCDKSLLQFLRDNHNTFLKNKDTCYENQPPSPSYQNRILLDETWTFSTLDLIRWSGQIANGMEFLSEKRIVHGDLAARNVLLCFARNVKICDFGLARQLIDYNYIKTKQCPLPWKWMAIESLTNMKFSTMSDVWAYGITLWEIFSLGQAPYAGLAWNVDFVDQLTNGLRMTRPAHASDKIFGIMTDCWEPEPNARPTFRSLKQFFATSGMESVKSEAVAKEHDGYLEPKAFKNS